MRKLSIIIPTWNEERIIEKTLSAYVEYFSGKYDFEVIVVMDGCTDRTPEIVERFCENHPNVRYFSFSKKLGKGGAIIQGFKAAKAEFVAFTDADGSTSPEELYRMVESIGDWDGILGSRWSDESVILKKESYGRILASRGFNLLVRLFFDLPFRDTQCGAKVFKNYVIRDVVDGLGITNFAFDVDLLYRISTKGYKVKEIPIKWTHDNNSNLRLGKVIPTMFISVVGLRIKVSPLWPFVPKWFVRLLYDKMKSV